MLCAKLTIETAADGRRYLEGRTCCDVPRDRPCELVKCDDGTWELHFVEKRDKGKFTSETLASFVDEGGEQPSLESLLKVS